MDENKKNRIMSKIKKCLALSQSSNPNEAAAALRQAHALLKKHNLSLIDIENSNIVESKSVQERSKVHRYEKDLSFAVASMMDCVSVTNKKYNGKTKSGKPKYKESIFFMGYDSDVEIAEYTYQVLNRQLIKAREDFIETIKFLDSSEKQRRANIFCRAWVFSVYNIILEFADRDKTKVDNIKNSQKNVKEGRKSVFKTRQEDADILEKGEKEGKKAKLWKGTSNQKERQYQLEHNNQ